MCYYRSFMDKFTVKTNFWGTKTYYDKNGNEIGQLEHSFFGDDIIVKNGKRIGTVGHDYLGREEIELESSSIFSNNKKMIDSSAPEDWEYCDNCDEWDGGEDTFDHEDHSHC